LTLTLTLTHTTLGLTEGEEKTKQNKTKQNKRSVHIFIINMVCTMMECICMYMQIQRYPQHLAPNEKKRKERKTHT
ncbi:MAG: hypothetical protein ACK559_33025, partial [bacterium]